MTILGRIATMSKPRIRIKLHFNRLKPWNRFYYWSATMPSGRELGFGGVAIFRLDETVADVLKEWRKQTR